MIRADGIDVLLELGGHTAGNRLGVLARRPAPLQATWLGYPNTTGMPEVDLRITDAVADPDVPGAPWTAEAQCRLPGGFLAWRPALDPPIPPRAPGPVRFGSFNHLAKVSPSTLRLWRDVLAAAPGSTLLVKSSVLSDPPTAEAFRARAEAAGIDGRRLALAGHVAGEADHLAAYAGVDVALDTWPYHGTTTTCETLWMGVAVVTLAGRAHVSRVSASILAHAGLADLAAPTPEAYVALAAGLAADAPRRAALREGLRDRLRASPLLDAARLVRELEVAFAGAWSTLLAGGGA